MSSENAIEVSDVSKNFGKVEALNGVNLTAKKGKVTGLLGPNGAGKSTLIKIMTTLLPATEGKVFVDGVDVENNPEEARKRIGLAGQFAAVDDFLTGRETLEMVAKLYGMDKNEAQKRTVSLLKKLDLSDAADRQTKTYSGGMRRRLDLGASLVATPKVLFLDEPTTGLDPRTRLQLWDVIRDLVNDGVTILLTTQYLEEADVLCDHIYVVDKGKMIIDGTSAELKNSLGQDIIDLKVPSDKLSKSEKLLKTHFTQEVITDKLSQRITLKTKSGTKELLKVAEILDKAKIPIDELSVHRPSLDEVFLSVTGNQVEGE